MRFEFCCRYRFTTYVTRGTKLKIQKSPAIFTVRVYFLLHFQNLQVPNIQRVPKVWKYCRETRCKSTSSISKLMGHSVYVLLDYKDLIFLNRIPCVKSFLGTPTTRAG